MGVVYREWKAVEKVSGDATGRVCCSVSLPEGIFMKAHTHTILVATLLLLPLATSPAHAAQSALPDSIPGLPQGSVKKAPVPASTRQEDRDFLQQIEANQPVAAPGPKIEPPEEMEDASTPRLAKMSPSEPEIVRAEPAPQAEPASTPTEALSPAEAAIRPSTSDAARHAEEPPSVTRNRTVEPPHAPSVRHTTSHSLPPLIAQNDGTTDIAPAPVGGFQAPPIRTTRTVTTYVSGSPYERTVTVVPEPQEEVPFVTGPDIYERPRHHGFFHRIFHHDDY
jgi:hypothetical protein